MKVLKPFFKAAVQPDGTLEILIYEEIGYDFWTDGGVTAKTVKQQIDQAGAFSKISLRINSPGGDAFEGVAIGNLLKSTGKPVEVSVDGIAASAASIIAMCGTTITMGHNAMMMIHNAWTVEIGDATAMRKMADRLEKIDQAIAQTYVDRTGKPLGAVKVLMDAETWMNAEECVKEGFATSIAASDDTQASALAMAKNFKTLARMKRVPEALKAKSAPKADRRDGDGDMECECSCEACMDGRCEECSNAECEDPNCKDCPMQQGANSASPVELIASAEVPPEPAAVVVGNASLFQAKQWEMEHLKTGRV